MKGWRADWRGTKRAGGCQMIEEDHKRWREGKKGTKSQESPREIRGQD